jgi:hypothetical protein
MTESSRKPRRTFLAAGALSRLAALGVAVCATFAVLAPSAFASGNYVYHDSSQNPGWGGEAPLTWIKSEGDNHSNFTDVSGGSCTGASPDKSTSHWLYSAYDCSSNDSNPVYMYEAHSWGWTYVGKQAGNGGSACVLCVYDIWGWESW